VHQKWRDNVERDGEEGTRLRKEEKESGLANKEKDPQGSLLKEK